MGFELFLIAMFLIIAIILGYRRENPHPFRKTWANLGIPYHGGILTQEIIDETNRILEPKSLESNPYSKKSGIYFDDARQEKWDKLTKDFYAKLNSQKWLNENVPDIKVKISLAQGMLLYVFKELNEGFSVPLEIKGNEYHIAINEDNLSKLLYQFNRFRNEDAIIQEEIKYENKLKMFNELLMTVFNKKIEITFYLIGQFDTIDTFKNLNFPNYYKDKYTIYEEPVKITDEIAKMNRRERETFFKISKAIADHNDITAAMEKYKRSKVEAKNKTYETVFPADFKKYATNSSPTVVNNYYSSPQNKRQEVKIRTNDGYVQGGFLDIWMSGSRRYNAKRAAEESRNKPTFNDYYPEDFEA